MVAVENHIRGGGGTDVGDRAPELSVLLHPVPVLPAAHHLGHFPAAAPEFLWRGGQTTLNVVPQGHQVAHHQFGAFKHPGVQSLKHEGAGRSTGAMALVGHQKGVVDVAGAQGADGRDPFAGMEATRNGFNGLAQGDLNGLRLQMSR